MTGGFLCRARQVDITAAQGGHGAAVQALLPVNPSKRHRFDCRVCLSGAAGGDHGGAGRPRRGGAGAAAGEPERRAAAAAVRGLGGGAEGVGHAQRRVRADGAGRACARGHGHAALGGAAPACRRTCSCIAERGPLLCTKAVRVATKQRMRSSADKCSHVAHKLSQAQRTGPHACGGKGHTSLYVWASEQPG